MSEETYCKNCGKELSEKEIELYKVLCELCFYFAILTGLEEL
jgi:hypothetical protein